MQSLKLDIHISLIERYCKLMYSLRAFILFFTVVTVDLMKHFTPEELQVWNIPVLAC